MNTTINENHDITPPLNIGASFGDATSDAIKAAQANTALPSVKIPENQTAYWQQYFELCKKDLPEGELFPDFYLGKLLDDFGVSDLKLLVPPGARVCIAAVPFGLYGHSLGSDELRNRVYIRVFIILPDGTTRGGLINYPSRHYQLLPQMVQDVCTSEPFVYDDGSEAVTRQDLERADKNIRKTYQRAKQLFDSPFFEMN